MPTLFRSNRNRSRDDVAKEVVESIRAILGHEGGGEYRLTMESRLGADLEMSSLQMVQLAGAVQRRLGARPFPFQELFYEDEDQHAQDIQVSQLVDFLYRQLQTD